MSQAIVERNPRQAGGLAYPKEPPSGPAYGFAPSLLAFVDPGSPQADAIRTLRTHVMAQHIDRGRRALAICAPSEGVGSTFIAVNLAIALSQIGLKTLLIDGNLRRPGVDRLIRLRGSVTGLSECLQDLESTFANYIHDAVLPGLSVLFAGQPPINPQELLAADRFKALMDSYMRDFDVTIVDTPPANISSDARRISNVIGYSLIVASKNHTFVNDVKILSRQLKADHALVVGAVLNQA